MKLDGYMKIGILTQPLQNNYGGLLQNYALQKVLVGIGHEVETIDWQPIKESAIKEWLYYRKMLFLSYIKMNTQRPQYQLTDSEAAIIGQNTCHFVEKFINVCPQKARKPEEFTDIDDRYSYDAYIVGSDQVWRPRYNGAMTSAMFLDFVKHRDVKRIAYAASFGTSEWEFTSSMTEICAQLAQKFDLVTVREKSGVDLCRENFGVKAQHVLDPTLLLCKEDYERLVKEEKEPSSEGSLFHYILDPSEEKKAFIENVARDQGLKPFTIMPKCQVENRTRKDVKKHIEDCVFPPVTSWLRGFMDARMVIVDSFHGAVFSIIFNKPFWVLGNKERGNTRFESLLALFDLEDRMITIEDNMDWNRTIDWDRINEKIKFEQNRCLDLLKTELSKKK